MLTIKAMVKKDGLRVDRKYVLRTKSPKVLTEVFPYPYRVLSVNGIVTMTDAFVCDAIKEILIEIRLKYNANSENRRKIAAKNSEQFVKTYNFEMFTKRHDMLPQNMPILCGIYQILALSAEYRPYFPQLKSHSIVKKCDFLHIFLR